MSAKETRALGVTPPVGNGVRLAGNTTAQKVRLPAGYERSWLRVRARGQDFHVRFQVRQPQHIAADVTAVAIQDSTITSDEAAEHANHGMCIPAGTFEDFDPAVLLPGSSERLWVTYINAVATGAKLEIEVVSGGKR